MRPGVQNNRDNLVDAFFRCIWVDEEFAEELAQIAHRCELDGNPFVAASLRNIGCNHWTEGMEGLATLAVLPAQRADTLDGEISL